MCLQLFFFLSCFFYFYLLEFLSFYRLYIFDDESDNNRSGFGSAGMCDFPFCSDESVGNVGKSIGCVGGVASIVFVLTGIESIGDVVPLVVFIPNGIDSKVGRLIELF